MDITILNTTKAKAGSVPLPAQFSETVRADLIKRAVLSLQANKRQTYGAKPEAGKRPSVRISKRRHDYRGTYGIGQSRTPRKVMSVRGTRFNWEGAFAPQTVGGRRAHAPNPEKDWSIKINTKERRKAIRSALAATIDITTVKERGHIVPDNYPFAISKDFETLAKTKDLKDALIKLGLAEELERADNKKVRAGKGTMRGRPYKNKKSVLIVTGTACELHKAAANIPGVDVVEIKELNTEDLAPGTTPGRLTLYTESALAELAKGLFTDKYEQEAEEQKVAEAKKKVVKKSETKASGSSTTKKTESAAKVTSENKEVSA